MELWKERLARLLTVKSLVTLMLTAVFAVMVCAGRVEQDFMTVYTVVIAFYFGTQTEKKNREDGSVEAAEMSADGK